MFFGYRGNGVKVVQGSFRYHPIDGKKQILADSQTVMMISALEIKYCLSRAAAV